VALGLWGWIRLAWSLQLAHPPGSAADLPPAATSRRWYLIPLGHIAGGMGILPLRALEKGMGDWFGRAGVGESRRRRHRDLPVVSPSPGGPSWISRT
jgi:hypothetical protein